MNLKKAFATRDLAWLRYANAQLAIRLGIHVPDDVLSHLERAWLEASDRVAATIETRAA